MCQGRVERYLLFKTQSRRLGVDKPQAVNGTEDDMTCFIRSRQNAWRELIGDEFLM